MATKRKSTLKVSTPKSEVENREKEVIEVDIEPVKSEDILKGKEVTEKNIISEKSEDKVIGIEVLRYRVSNLTDASIPIFYIKDNTKSSKILKPYGHLTVDCITEDISRLARNGYLAINQVKGD